MVAIFVIVIVVTVAVVIIVSLSSSSYSVFETLHQANKWQLYVNNVAMRTYSQRWGMLEGLELQYVHHIARRSGLDALNNIIV